MEEWVLKYSALCSRASLQLQVLIRSTLKNMYSFAKPSSGQQNVQKKIII